MFRPDPLLAAGDYKRYSMRRPLATHTRVATCSEVGCAAHENGWVTRVDESTTLGQHQAHYIRSESGRHFTIRRDESGLTVFRFPEGQRCFQDHRVSLDRPETFLVLPGDHRVHPQHHEVYRHANAANWVDDFAGHQQKLADSAERG